MGRSYFFELFIKRDINNSSWQSIFGYEQSKLGEYLYGFWLYPLYLQERKTRENGYDYIKFLIDYGLYRLDGLDGEKYLNDIPHKSNYLIGIVDTIARDFFSGYPQDFVYRYGFDVLKPLSLIYYARIINAILLVFSVVILYFLMMNFLGFRYAFLASLLYGFNSLIVFSSLKAHAEALFLFTFNLGLFFIYLYFTQKNFKILYFLFFSISAGLCMSIKLNGIILILCFFIVSIIYLIIFKEMKHILKYALISVFSVVISLGIFIIINPSTWSDVIYNVARFYSVRVSILSEQIITYSESFLPNPFSRLQSIFAYHFFSDERVHFNSIEPLRKNLFETESPVVPYYYLFLFLFFLLGNFSLFKKVFIEKHVGALVFISCFYSVVTFMSYYLLLNWSRYYVQLVLFFVVFEVIGFFLVMNFFKRGGAFVYRVMKKYANAFQGRNAYVR